MADKTSIEWTDTTWNIVTGCSVVSPGCTNCYAMRLAGTRLRHHASRQGLTVETKAGPVWSGEVRFNEEWLLQPLLWRRPRRVFVCAHGDLFHESVPDEWIDRVFAVMVPAPRVFQVLTKRPERMRRYILDPGTPRRVARAVLDLWIGPMPDLPKRCDRWPVKSLGEDPEFPEDVTLHHWPSENIWLGFSAEDQQRLDERWSHMEALADAGWLTWCSAEPLLGHLDVTAVLAGGLRWIVVGGESGPKARPMDLDWVRSIVAQCRNAGVACFVKQLGQRPYEVAYPAGVSDAEAKAWMRSGWTRITAQGNSHWRRHWRFRDKKGGDMLEWPEDLRVREFPEPRP